MRDDLRPGKGAWFVSLPYRAPFSAEIKGEAVNGTGAARSPLSMS